MPRLLLGVLALAVACLPAFAQPAPADAAKAGIAKYKEERADAEKTFTKAELAAADEQAAKAEAALAGGNADQAARLITEARWQLPVQQKNLPENVSRVLGAARLRHGDRVNGLAYSPDGTKLVSASRDGTVRVWDVGNGRELIVYRGHEAAPFDDEEARVEKGVIKKNVRRVFGVAVSADGKLVASAGADEVHVWAAADGKLVKTLKGHKGDVTCLAFAPKSADVLLTGGSDKRFVVWDVTKDKPTFTSEEQTTPIEVVAFSPDERFLVAGDASGSAVVFAVGKYDKLVFGSKVTDSNAVRAVAFSRDASGLVVGGEKGQLKVVGGPGGPESGLGTLVTRLDGNSGAVNGVGLTPDGKLLASVADSRTVIVYELAAGKQIRAFQTESSAKKGTCLAVRPDGKQVAAGFESGQIRLFPLSASDDHRTFNESKEKLMAAAYSPDGKQFATAGGDAVVRVYDAVGGAVTKELKGHKIAVTALAWVNNTTLASAGADKLVKVWDVNAGTAKDAAGHTVAVLAVAADPAGKVLLSGGADKTVRGWDPTTGQPTKLKFEGTSAVCAIAMSADGKRAAVGLANGKLQLFTVKDDALTLTGEAAGAHSAGVASVAFHPTADKVATCGGDGVVRLWTAPETGTPGRERECDLPFKPTAGSPPMPVTSVAFSPDGKLLVGGGSEGVVRVWEAASGGEVRGLRGHAGWVTSVQFSADGKSVLSCGVDAAAKVFDLPRGEAAATGHSAQVNCVAVSRDGKYAATGSGDMTVKVWDLATGREVATLTGEGNDKGGSDGAGILTVVFVGNDRVAAAGHEKVLRTWTFAPVRLVNTKQLKESAFVLAADPDGTATAAAWVNLSGSGDKTKAGFDLFQAGGEVVSAEVTSKGKDDATSSAALSPDAKWGVIGGADGVISIWDLTKKERIGGEWPILKKVRVADMGVTPDRLKVVVIDDNGEVSVGDTTKREVTAKVKAVDGEVRGVVVAPTADRFATLSGDGTVKAWGMDCKELRTWKLPHAPTCAVFTADGKRLITGNQDGTAFVLELPAK
jgi:WD40 repeat protein